MVVDDVLSSLEIEEGFCDVSPADIQDTLGLLSRDDLFKSTSLSFESPEAQDDLSQSELLLGSNVCRASKEGKTKFLEGAATVCIIFGDMQSGLPGIVFTFGSSNGGSGISFDLCWRKPCQREIPPRPLEQPDGDSASPAIFVFTGGEDGPSFTELKKNAVPLVCWSSFRFAVADDVRNELGGSTEAGGDVIGGKPKCLLLRSADS